MALNLETLNRVIESIHATPQMAVIDFAGAGAQALTWLHSVGGSSRTVLEATDRYAPASLIESIGFTPPKFASLEVARAMAVGAYTRACYLVESVTPVLGVGCSAAIATDRRKRGDHGAFVSVCDHQGVTSYALQLVKGGRTRQEEEQVVSQLILQAIAAACEPTVNVPMLDLLDDEELTSEYEPVDWPARLLAGDINWVAIAPNGETRPGKKWSNIALLSGAFNPLHYGHRQLARVAAEILGQDVYFELPLVNADKGPLDLNEAHRRACQFVDISTVLLTKTPLFNQKTDIFPGSTFVIGADTAQRLWQPRFYNNDPLQMYSAFNTIASAQCQFLVAARCLDDEFLLLPDIDIPAGYQALFTEIPADIFRIDISSTVLRA